MSDSTIVDHVGTTSDSQVNHRSKPAVILAWSGNSLMTLMRLIRRLLRALFFVVISPFLFLRSLRRNMTAASVSVLLTGIMTLNIIWGYPWVGMFAACVSMMCIGLFVNYWMRPQFRLGFSLPAHTPAGQPCGVVAHCTNTRRVPAFDFSVSLRSNVSKWKRRSDAAAPTSDSPANYFAIARPGDHFDVSATVVFPVRGMHPLPALKVVSSFPFHLFRSTIEIESNTTIAVTPQPLSGDQDAAARALLLAVGGWSRRVAAGDALDYTGSREYLPGMPVRRWDFVSWARLGRPIVREFQSPSVQSALLIVDTSSVDDADAHAAELMERALSLAASALSDLAAKSIRVKMYVTSESPEQELESARLGSSVADVESMLIRLAKATATESAEADERIGEVMAESSGCPTLLITARQSSSAMDDLSGLLNVVCVTQDHEDVPLLESSARPPISRLDRSHRAIERPDAMNAAKSSKREVAARE